LLRARTASAPLANYSGQAALRCKLLWSIFLIGSSHLTRADVI
jgi:hypothetical protein